MTYCPTWFEEMLAHLKSFSWKDGLSGAENEGRGQAAKEPLLQEPRKFFGGTPNVTQLD